MKKTNIKLLTFAILLITNLLLQTKLFALEEYVPKVIIQGKWGSGPGEFGLENGEQILGPTGYAVKKKYIYIWDYINQRVQIFNDNGKYIKLIKINGGKKFCVDGDNNIYIGSSIDIVKYDANGKLLRKYLVEKETGTKIFKIEIDEFNSLWIKGYNNRDFEINPNGFLKETKRKLKRGKSGYFFIDQEIDDTVGNVVKIYNDKKQKKTIFLKMPEKFKDKILTDKYKLREAKFVGMDNENNIYILLKIGTFSTRVKEPNIYFYQVNKYNTNARLLKEIQIYEEYPKDRCIDVQVDENGNIYGFFWKVEDGVKIMKWEKK